MVLEPCEQRRASLPQGTAKSVALGAAAAIGLAASAYFGIGYVRYERLAAAEQAAVIRAERANADLQDALARLRDQVGGCRPVAQHGAKPNCDA